MKKKSDIEKHPRKESDGNVYEYEGFDNTSIFEFEKKFLKYILQNGLKLKNKAGEGERDEEEGEGGSSEKAVSMISMIRRALKGIEESPDLTVEDFFFLYDINKLEYYFYRWKVIIWIDKVITLEYLDVLVYFNNKQNVFSIG
jgi:hypothetical protein